MSEYDTEQTREVVVTWSCTIEDFWVTLIVFAMGFAAGWMLAA